MKSTCPTPAKADRSVKWLQSITLGWMLVECAGSIFAASPAHSVALLAFGSDSLVELFSATIVLFQFTHIFRISRERAARMAGGLLFVLAGVVGLIALVAMAGKVKAERSLLGISITAGALVLMPILALLKRRKAIETSDRALAADAVQSATCAYLAAITLAALCLQALLSFAGARSSGGPVCDSDSHRGGKTRSNGRELWLPLNAQRMGEHFLNRLHRDRS